MREVEAEEKVSNNCLTIFFSFLMLSSHKLLPASVFQEVRGGVRKKIGNAIWRWGEKELVKRVKGGCCRWQVWWAEGGGGKEGARKMILSLKRNVV